MRGGLVAGFAIAALGCRYQPQVVPIVGESGDLARLAGQWTGEYVGIDSHRSGTISFTIKARGDSAFGEVLMIAPLEENLLQPVDLVSGHSAHVRSPDLLAIQFVRVDGGGIRGELEPYIAPDCECPVRTVFTGSLNGAELSGSFLTTTDWGGRQTGTWWVTRSKR